LESPEYGGREARPILIHGKVKMRRLIVALLFVFTFSDGKAQSQTPKEIVLAFYKLALTDMKPKDAFARYMSADFVEHSADTPGGTAQATVSFLSDLIKKSPQPKWEIVRSIAEGDLVFLHVRFTPAPNASPIVIGEIFRVRGNTITEHWDIIQHAPEHPVNPNSIF
jgi:predicted SnoaL-like aldol condensation-catalyzing enzyme